MRAGKPAPEVAEHLRAAQRRSPSSWRSSRTSGSFWFSVNLTSSAPSRCPCAQAGDRCVAQRRRDGRVHVGRHRRDRRRVDGLERHIPDRAIGWIEDQHAQPILCLLDGGLGDDQLLLSAATSACAERRSSGGDWPTSTLALFTRTSSCARSSDDCRASTAARADARFQYRPWCSPTCARRFREAASRRCPD